MAAGLLWILDASINITMEPFRAFVADKLPEEQRTLGFVMQSFFIGIGQTLGERFALHFHCLGVVGVMASGIPFIGRILFQDRRGVFLIGCPVDSRHHKEYPPETMAAFERMKREKKGIVAGFTEIFSSVAEMPKTMKQLAVVQFFTWFALPCMWQFFGIAIARHVFLRTGRKIATVRTGDGMGRSMLSPFTISSVLLSRSCCPGWQSDQPQNRSHDRPSLWWHRSDLRFIFIANKWMLFLSMAGVGIAWASILSMPYVILSTAVPASRMGVYMGVFNLFIVIPQIVMSLIVPNIFNTVLSADPRNAVVLGGISLLMAAASVMIVRDPGGSVPVQDVIRGDAQERLTVQQSAQAVPATGLIDEK